MLKSLQVQNYALIDNADIAFQEGFTTLTGQTGSGKSILMDALALLLGERADVQSLRNKDEKCVVEASFDLSNYHYEPIFQHLDLDFHPLSILRREILPQGKSRAFVNDSPVNISTLKELGQHLLQIHAQHDTLQIGKTAFQFEWLDACTKSEAIFAQYSTAYQKYLDLKNQVLQLENLQKQENQEKGYQQFIYQELKTAQLEKGELEKSLEKEREMASAESYKLGLHKVLTYLQGDMGAQNLLKESINTLQKLDIPKLEETLARLDAVYQESKDVATEIENYADALYLDAEELYQLRERISTYQRLLKKHNFTDAEQLLQLEENLAQLLSQSENIEEKLQNLRIAYDKQHKETQACADKLHENRASALPNLQQSVQDLLARMSMPHAEFQIELSPSEFNAWGAEKIQFLFRANKGGSLQNIEKVASGGEMARVVLALKHLLAGYKKLPTLILDEVDTGVSGEVAMQMGRIMRELSKNMQVLAITHLPQVAAQGKAQLKVYKQDVDERAETHIKYLSPVERITEIAKMLSGENVSPAALENAKALLQENAHQTLNV